MTDRSLTDYRPIELQSPRDFTHLLTQSRLAARAKIAQNLPGAVPSSSSLPQSSTTAQADELVSKVESLVDEYILQTFSAIHDNVSINGMAPPPLEQLLPGELRRNGGVGAGGTGSGSKDEGDEYQYEAFDTALHERVTALQARLEVETVKTTELRRTAPEMAAKAFKENWLASAPPRSKALSDGPDVPAKDDAMEGLEKEGVKKVAGESVERVLRFPALEDMGDERRVEMEASYVEAVRTLQGVKRGLGDALAKAERAEKVATYFWDQKA